MVRRSMLRFGALPLALLPTLAVETARAATDGSSCSSSPRSTLSSPLVELSKGAPDTLVPVAVEQVPDGAVAVRYGRAEPDLTDVVDGWALGPVETQDCEVGSPIPCGTCWYSPHDYAECSGCGSCTFTPCGSGKACELKHEDCWVCNPWSWSWCNPPQTVGWECRDCCS